MKNALRNHPANVIALPAPKATRTRPEALVSGRFKIVPFANRTDTPSWRVVGSKRDGTRVRENFAEEASARCRHIELETEYLKGHKETVIRATKLSAEQIQIFELAAVKLGDDWQHILDAVDLWKRSGKQHAVAESPRLDDAVAKYLLWLDTPDCILRDSTKRKYRYRIGTTFRNSVPNHRVSDFTPDQIEDFITKKGTLPSDKDTLKRAVSSFFTWCIERPRRWAMVNPCREVKISIPENDAPPVILTLPECESLLRSTKPAAPKAKPSAAASLPATISSAQFEKLSGLSERRLRQLADAGKLPQPKAGRWQTVESVRALVGHYRSATVADELEAARVAKLETENRLLLLDEAQRNDELISFSAAVETIQRAHGDMVQKIMGWTQHPVELREEIVLKIRAAGEFFHSQLIANRKKHENETPENPQAPA